MRLLLDSHILLAIAKREVTKYGAKIELLIKSSGNDIFVSAASLWEIAIKYRLGKLDLESEMKLEDFPDYFVSLGFLLMPVDHRHAIEDLIVQPNTKDPFDRLLLAQCQVEAMRLVTVDRSLESHPLVWRER